MISKIDFSLVIINVRVLQTLNELLSVSKSLWLTAFSTKICMFMKVIFMVFIPISEKHLWKKDTIVYQSIQRFTDRVEVDRIRLLEAYGKTDQSKRRKSTTRN